MSTSKDGSKKNSSISKKNTAVSKASSTKKRESSTDRVDSKKKEVVDKIKPASSLSKVSENASVIKSKISKVEKVDGTSKVLPKTEKIQNTSNVLHKTGQVQCKSKVVSKTEKVQSTSKIFGKAALDPKKSSKPIKKDSSKQEVSVTPPSSRVKKTQYFPSKNLYSNALKSTDLKSKIIEESTVSSKNLKNVSSTPRKSKIIEKLKVTKPSAGVVVKKDERKPGLMDSTRSVRAIKSVIKKTTRSSSPETSSVSERPRTATLRKGSIVNANIVGPETPKIVKNIPIKQKSPSPNNSDNYEDDFDSYESDFEEYSSGGDTSNLAKVSGEGETSSISSGAEDNLEKKEPYSQSLVKDSFASIVEDERTLDSGTFELPEFKHRQILEHIKESVEKEYKTEQDRVNHASLPDEGFEDQKSLQMMNFVDAKKRCEKRRASEVRRKRGEEILSMIRLDNVSFTLFDSPAVPYEVFMSIYGKSNSVQTSVQTGDDNTSEEIQTEQVELRAKWTQMPAKFSGFDQSREGFWEVYKNDYVGVGCDEIQLNIDDVYNIRDDHSTLNDTRLAKFLTRTSELILDIMAEENITNLDKLSKNKRDIPFSEGYLSFNTSEDIFKNTKVQTASIFSKSVNKILTVHVKTADIQDIKSVVCIWDISNFNSPQTIFISFGEVCCSTFSFNNAAYIFAGLRDGTILVWDAKEKSKIYNILSRTPSYSSLIGSSHFSKVISIHSMGDGEDRKIDFMSTESSEICSLDEDGDIIIWDLYTNSGSKKSSNIMLIKTATVSLSGIYPELPDLQCSESIYSKNNLYVSTNYGYILHCAIDGSRSNVKKFAPKTICEAICLEQCPFSSSYFLSGHLNGNITLYSGSTERPLIVLRNNEDIENSAIEIIQWSKSKPFIFYAKDSQNTVHIWDLSKSDMYPEYSIPFTKDISCLRLSPIMNMEQKEISYMIIGTGDGKLYLHLLNNEYGQENYDVYKEHVKTFLNYASRL